MILQRPIRVIFIVSGFCDSRSSLAIIQLNLCALPIAERRGTASRCLWGNFELLFRSEVASFFSDIVVIKKMLSFG